MSQPSAKPMGISVIASWLKLIRVPNLATAIADPLAGFLIVGGFYEYETLPFGGWLAIASSLCLYAACTPIFTQPCLIMVTKYLPACLYICKRTNDDEGNHV